MLPAGSGQLRQWHPDARVRLICSSNSPFSCCWTLAITGERLKVEGRRSGHKAHGARRQANFIILNLEPQAVRPILPPSTLDLMPFIFSNQPPLRSVRAQLWFPAPLRIGPTRPGAPARPVRLPNCRPHGPGQRGCPYTLRRRFLHQARLPDKQSNSFP